MMNQIQEASGRLTEIWDRLVASDPGLTRLQMAGSAAIGVASALLVEFGFAALIHAGKMGTIIFMLLGAVVTMMGMMALNGPRILPKIRTAVFFPVAIGIGLLCGVLVSGNTVLMLVIFVVVMFAAVVVRQYGIPFFFYGFMGWLGFFFATFTHAKLAMIPMYLAAIVVGTVWVLTLSSTLMKTNPQKNLQRTVFALRSRARTMIKVCADILSTSDPKQRERLKKKLRANQVKVAEAALMVEGWTAEPDALPPDRSGPSLRRMLIDVQHVLNRMADSTNLLIESDKTVIRYAAGIAERLARRDDQLVKKDVKQFIKCSKAVTHQENGPSIEHESRDHLAVRQFSEAVLEFVELAKQVTTGQKDPEVSKGAVDEFEPVVGLFFGNLPGSPAVARDVTARGARWNPLARMSLVNRQALQVAVAGGLAIIFGRELSPMRYYWAVIAAFVMFTGTATRSETFLKGLNRVLGTLAGLVVAIWVAHLTAGHIPWVLLTIVACIFCGFYLIRISYAYMIFFITIMVGQLYSVMHMFSPGLLFLRLEETAVGACVGFLVALIFVPLSTRDTIRRARNNLLNSLEELLSASAQTLSKSDNPPDSDDEKPSNLDALTLSLDDRMRQLSLVVKPLNSVMMRRQNARVRHRVALYAAITNEARALTVALRQPDTPAAEELASICHGLAKTVSQLAEDASEQLQSAATEELANVESTLFGDLSISPDEMAANPIYNSVLQLKRMLEDLCEDAADPL
ncbi:MAG TPA: FUSC family protein [Bacillales bacterium]|nr:FUSC family protein [Bacillales bacterium]